MFLGELGNPIGKASCSKNRNKLLCLPRGIRGHNAFHFLLSIWANAIEQFLPHILGSEILLYIYPATPKNQVAATLVVPNWNHFSKKSQATKPGINQVEIRFQPILWKQNTTKCNERSDTFIFMGWVKVRTPFLTCTLRNRCPASRASWASSAASIAQAHSRPAKPSGPKKGNGPVNVARMGLAESIQWSLIIVQMLQHQNYNY